MMKIWLARHAEAVDPEQANSDFDRRLTGRGRQQVSEMIRWLGGREPYPELILHSPLVRAQQTAETVANEIGLQRVTVQLENLLSPGINTDHLLGSVALVSAKVVICIGHQPDMSRCLAEMIDGGQIQFSPGSIACVEFGRQISRGRGVLRWISEPNWFG